MKKGVNIVNGKIFVQIFNKIYNFLDKKIGIKKIINPDDILFKKGYYINTLNNKNKISIVKIYISINNNIIQLKNSDIKEEEFHLYYDLFLKNKIEIYYDYSFSAVEKRRKNGFRKNKSTKFILRM